VILITTAFGTAAIVFLLLVPFCRVHVDDSFGIIFGTIAISRGYCSERCISRGVIKPNRPGSLPSLARAFVLEHQYSSSDVHEIEEGDGREYQQAYPDTLSRKRWVPAPVGLATGSRQDWFPHGACNDDDNDNDDGGGGGNKDDDTAGDKDVDETLLVSENK
jgi:hypothetical protein